jgi:hypothetical protein
MAYSMEEDCLINGAEEVKQMLGAEDDKQMLGVDVLHLVDFS